MTPETPKKLRSKCCGAPMKVAGAPDFAGDAEAGTNYYICDLCDKPTDPAYEESEPKKEPDQVITPLGYDGVPKTQPVPPSEMKVKMTMDEVHAAMDELVGDGRISWPIKYDEFTEFVGHVADLTRRLEKIEKYLGMV